MDLRRSGIATAALLPILSWLVPTQALAQNPGDPLFCQPQEGVTYLIVNGGAGVFTADPDCYNNNSNNDPDNTLSTGQGGTLTGVKTGGGINYTYAPPTAGFTGLDTFTIHVTTVFNAAGGTGSAGGTTRPGGPTTLDITLNVIPASVNLIVPGSPTLVPVPAGSITGCSTPGSSGLGPVAGAIFGCITSVIRGSGGVAPSHGTLTTSGNTLLYTPTSGYTGPDTFTYQALGVNNDGVNALNSGNVTVVVNATPLTPAPPAWSLMLLGLLGLGIGETWRRRKQSAAA